ncbi:MAG TPA: hypothetical protein VIJ93_02795, partial [bacterium]
MKTDMMNGRNWIKLVISRFFLGASFWDNNFKRIKYIYNDKDCDVEMIKTKKRQIRRLIKILFIIPGLLILFCLTISV